MGGPERVSKPKERQVSRTAVAAVPSAAHPVLQMQSTMGNQAVGRMIQRQPAPGAGGGGQRTILIDANVIGEINRGNRAAARTLLDLRGSAKVYISQQAFNELTAQPGSMIAGVGPDLPRIAKANSLLLQEMGIEVAPPGAMADRVGAHADNIQNMRGNIAPEDMAHIAQAKAIGAEVWSLDKTFRKNASMIEGQLGVKVAPESTSTPLAKPAREDYRVARKLLKLEEVEISVNGTVTRKPPKPPAGGGGAAPPTGPSFSPGGRSFKLPPGSASAGTASAIAREAAKQAASEMKLLKAARFLSTAGNILQGYDALETLNQFMGMTYSKLAGGGFLFSAQIEEAARMEREAKTLAANYRTFSESLAEGVLQLWEAAKDPVTAGNAGYHLADVLDRVTDLRRDLGERIEALAKSHQLVHLKREAAENILKSSGASGTIGALTFGSSQLAMLFAVSSDLTPIEGSLNGALTAFRGMADLLDTDIEILRGWDDFLFRTCAEAGYCSTSHVNAIWGTTRIRSYPAEE